MSISSIDTITLAPRTLNAAETQGKELSQNQTMETQNAVHFQHMRQQQAQQTVETQESETKDYEKNDGEGKGTFHQGQRKKKKNNGQSDSKMAPRSDSMFDIMI